VLEVPHATSGTKSARRVTAVLARGPGRFRLLHPRAAHGWVAHRLNCVEFTNAEAMARGAIHRRFFLPHSSSVFRLMAGASAFFILSQSAYRFLLEGMNPARPGTIAAHLNVFYLRVSREQNMISSPGRVRVMKALTRDR
jgi:hypothetical protein